jgi:hypothetical protein
MGSAALPLVNSDDPLALQRRPPGVLLTAGAAPAPAAASPLPRAGTTSAPTATGLPRAGGAVQPSMPGAPAAAASSSPASTYAQHLAALRAAPSSPARTSALSTAGSQPSAAQQNLTALQTSKPGYAQVKNPVLRGLATVGNIASGFFPKIAPLIPGTDAHHASGEPEESARQDTR